MEVDEKVRKMIPWILWYLWKTRNGIIFEGKDYIAQDVMARIAEEAEFWWLAQQHEKHREEEEKKRRTGKQKKSLEDAKLQATVWSLESLAEHHLNRVIIAFEDDTLVKVMLRPQAWPNFKWEHCELEKRLRRLEWWRLVKEDKSNNRGAFLIAQSAAKGGYLQSYVATGGPFWLRHLFESEEASPSF
ncbi:RNase H domain-containing protein [Raphanus sativus]|nr:RNase H domain-containing protein [Raphanus sativus]